ncbi:YbfB/YjiJ family MFS transporter [Tsukamurella sp. 8F]|uniref:YbfB/YjiJ family MFS transporter n=1 Tax=unclassified Tsukamurella TaxID=2633480 RepID=UPI0023B9C25A|nr:MULTISPECIES: YbfB/YjiJ family MFS transporter [unclassified Tsukamurella]MDF0532095.1 YbfB/YjiJ family MFS transporter [Tsukamurella sp. 8J]MDF0589227.1 YbfB/YjiJ family MFS transporter [Tsukamurella sp. 8F]
MIVDTKRTALGPRGVGVAASAGLAASMGIGRFVFTPLLPIMVASAGLTAGDGAVIATGNYAGYLVGSVVLARRPGLSRRSTFLAWAAALVASESLMAVSADVAWATALRFVAGVASAAVFLGCVSTVAHHRAHAGVAIAGVGAGIAMSGAYVLVAAASMSWQGLWLGAAVLTAVLLLPTLALDVRPEHDGATGYGRVQLAGGRRVAWILVLAAYFAEGVGYIVLGTFLPASVPGAHSGALVWTVAGLSAVPATVAWHAVGRRVGTGRALVAALAVQTAGAGLVAASGGVPAAMVGAVCFGGTFLGIVGLAFDFARGLGVGRAAATLTAAYAAGQVIGPLVVIPVIGHSFAMAFVIATVVLASASLLAAGAETVRRSLPR